MHELWLKENKQITVRQIKMQNVSFHQLAKGTKLNNTLKLVVRLSKAIPALLLTKFILRRIKHHLF